MWLWKLLPIRPLIGTNRRSHSASSQSARKSRYGMFYSVIMWWNLDSPPRQCTEGRRRNASFRSAFISRGDFQKHVLFAGFGAKHKREWQPRLRDGGRLI